MLTSNDVETIFRHVTKYRIGRCTEIARALADASRLRVILILRDRELCVCQIIELLGLAPSTVSKHMQILKAAGLVDSRKQGRWVHYSLNANPEPEVAGALEWVWESLWEGSESRRDRTNLERIVHLEPVLLRRIQRGCCDPGDDEAKTWMEGARSPLEKR